MEVSGKREVNQFSCKPCEENEIQTTADGFCVNCDEHMCTSCFQTHKKWKLNRDHILSDCRENVSKRESTVDFEKCEQHQDEPVKFYCTHHEQIGCGDCMIIGHRSCKVDYIPDLANETKVASKFETIASRTEICKEEADRVLSSIKNNIVQVDDINEKFKHDVYMFRDEMISRVNNMADRLLEEAESIKAEDRSTMTKLVEEIENVMKDLNVISELFESKMERPNQLFVCSVSKKPELDRLMKQLDVIKGKNNIEIYQFKSDRNLCLALGSPAQLGSLQKNNEKILNDGGTPVDAPDFSRKFVRQLKLLGADSEPLIYRQMVCRNIKAQGHFLSYLDNSNKGDVGLYVDKNKMKDRSYFEIEILSLGQRGTIAIGLVPSNYQENRQPGWEQNSIAYHADDGNLYHEHGIGNTFGPVCGVGDTIGCGIVYSFNRSLLRPSVTAIFTRNDTKVGERVLGTGPAFNLYAAVGMHSYGEKVRVILDAKMPALND